MDCRMSSVEYCLDHVSLAYRQVARVLKGVEVVNETALVLNLVDHHRFKNSAHAHCCQPPSVALERRVDLHQQTPDSIRQNAIAKGNPIRCASCDWGGILDDGFLIVSIAVTHGDAMTP